MNDIALRRPRKSALLWCRHEGIRPLRDERYKRCVLVVILYFALRNAREGLGKTALTAPTAGLGGAGAAQGEGAFIPYSSRNRRPLPPICAQNRETRTGDRSQKWPEICGLST